MSVRGFTVAFALAAVVLVLAVGVAGATLEQSDVGTLRIDDDRRTAVTAPGADLGAAFGAEAGAVRSEFAVASLETRLDRAPNRTARIAIVRTEEQRLLDRLDRIRERRRAASQAFLAGDRSAPSFALTLARTARAAERVRSERARVRSTVSLREDVSLSNGLDSALGSRSRIEGEALALEGPVRHRLWRAAITGDRRVVVLAASATGVAASDVTADTYTREVTRWDQHRPAGANAFRDAEGGPVSAAYDRAKGDFYPTAYGRAIDSPTNNPSILTYGGSIYRVTFPFDGGRIRAFVDGNTTEPFRELQRRSLSDFDREPLTNRTAEGLAVSVNGTVAEGPLLVTVSEAGSPANASVALANQSVGRTGADGRLWTVHPGEPASLTVRSSANRTVSLTLPANRTAS